MTWDDVCVIASELPSVCVGSYHGYPALRVAEKFLARLSDDRTSVEFKGIPVDEREMRLSVMPEVFYIPDGFRGAGIFARLSTLDEATLRELLNEGWRRAAPKALIRAFDAKQLDAESGGAVSSSVEEE